MEFIRLIRELGFSKKHSQGRNDDVFIDRLVVYTYLSGDNHL